MLDEDSSEVLSEVARTMVTNFPIQMILDHLDKRIVDTLPWPCRSAFHSGSVVRDAADGRLDE